MTHLSRDKLKPLLNEGPPALLYLVAISRIFVLALTVTGAYQLSLFRDLLYVLIGLYVLGLATSLLYLTTLYRQRHVPPLLTWTQMLVDFALVAVTLGFTGGVYSFFTFLMVIVILEAGLLLGMPQGFVFATLATIFVGMQSLLPSLPPHTPYEWIELGYRFLIQAMAFYLTAFVSGYWNQRVNRMEQFQRQILDNMNSGFLMTDGTGVVRVLNKAAMSILNLPAGSGAGQPVQQVLRPAAGECPVLTVLRSGHDFINYEFHTETVTGNIRMLEITTSRVMNAKGTNGVIVSFTDQTEMAEMRRELQRQDRLAAVGELAAGVAHEIRNPVAAIRGAMEELRAMSERGAVEQSPRMTEKLAAIALRESDHLNRIVCDFLQFARSPELRKEIFDLRDLAGEVKEQIQHQFGCNNGFRMVTILPDVPCQVSGDPSQLKLACLNMCENAYEAMTGHGTVTVTVAPKPGSFEVRFEDEGPGVHPEKISRIFEPFYTEKERAVGMGLAICMRIVTAHDGTIRVGAREGGGASFVVRLPAKIEKKEL
jgi:two-component system sensor histidine kinase PilS (NtrC family)